MKIELDERKVKYFNEYIAPQVHIPLEEIINNIFRAYLEQIGSRAQKSYAAWLKEQIREKERSVQEAN